MDKNDEKQKEIWQKDRRRRGRQTSRRKCGNTEKMRGKKAGEEEGKWIEVDWDGLGGRANEEGNEWWVEEFKGCKKSRGWKRTWKKKRQNRRRRKKNKDRSWKKTYFSRKTGGANRKQQNAGCALVFRNASRLIVKTRQQALRCAVMVKSVGNQNEQDV